MGRLKRIAAVVLIVLGAIGSGGCASMAESEFTPRRLDTSDYALAYQAALRATRETFQIAVQDASRGLIKTQPQRDVDKLAPASERRVSEVVVPRKQNIRRTAKVVIRRSGEAIFADCAVKLERLDSDIFESQHQREREFSDTGVETPIDRGAATDTAQQARWTDVGRDQIMEGKLLARIAAHVKEMESRGHPATTRAGQ